MSYNIIAKIATDEEFKLRVRACIAQEDRTLPSWWMEENIWSVAASPDFAKAYAYALNTGNEHPGSDETVITDNMILAGVQSVLGK